MKRAFVTGGTGFVGRHLLQELQMAGYDLWVLVQEMHQTQGLPANITFLEGDVLDLASVQTALAKAEPTVIFHLAGQASPSLSWQRLSGTFGVNTIGTAHVLEAAVQVGKPKVVVVTSADIYGLIQQEDLPITELTLAKPRHPYGISKVAAGSLVRIYWERYGLPAIEARPFNHIGPGQALGYVVPDFASQVAQIVLGHKEKQMMVGNLDAQRDFTDVRDVVRAYRLLADAGKSGADYLICSGQPISIHYLLTALLDLSGLNVEVVYDTNRMRPADVPCLYGDFAKIRRDVGWEPQIHLRQTLADALAEWMAHYKE